MKLVRKIISLLVGFIASVGLVVGVLYVFAAGDSVTQTIEHSHSIDTWFREAVAFVEAQKMEKGRLPSSSEFEQWASKYPRRPYTANGIWLIDSAFPPEAIKEFGSPTPGSYLLVYWRGEWDEYYASWTQKSTLVFDPSKYHMLGSGFADGAVVVFGGVLLLFLAVKLWPNKALNTDAPKSGVPVS